MTNVQEFVQMAVKNLGIPESVGQSATQGVLGLIQKQAGTADFQGLLISFSGAEELLKGAPGGAAPQTGAGGMLGGLMEKAGSALGGNLGATLGVAGMLKQTGLDAGKAGPFVALLVNFLKQKAGADLVGRLLAKIPEIAKLAG